MNNLQIIIAGPGAGKTYNLKNKVIDGIQNLDRNRFCAVITYTNAATDELRKRISSAIPIPSNVFIGTIHSFLIRFIIEPFAHLVNKIPIEKNYIENVSLNYKARNIFIERSVKQKIATTLIQSGILTYDTVIDQSKTVLD